VLGIADHATWSDRHVSQPEAARQHAWLRPVLAVALAVALVASFMLRHDIGAACTIWPARPGRGTGEPGPAAPRPATWCPARRPGCGRLPAALVRAAQRTTAGHRAGPELVTGLDGAEALAALATGVLIARAGAAGWLAVRLIQGTR
jgi:hypothetical protein